MSVPPASYRDARRRDFPRGDSPHRDAARRPAARLVADSGGVDMLLAAAVAVELRPFANRLAIPQPLPAVARGSHADRSIALVHAGMGRGGDQDFAAAVAALRPRAVVNVGIAGALDLAHPAGSAWIVEEWRQPHVTTAGVVSSGSAAPAAARAAEPATAGAVARADTDLSRQLGAALDAAGLEWSFAAAVTVDTPLHDAAERDRLAAASGAHLVEMEGAAWAALAAQLDVPFAAIRVVSDHADRPLPGPRRPTGRRAWLLNEDGTARRGRLLWAWLRSGAWLRPRYHYRELRAAGSEFAAALAGLEEVAVALFPNPPAPSPGTAGGRGGVATDE